MRIVSIRREVDSIYVRDLPNTLVERREEEGEGRIARCKRGRKSSDPEKGGAGRRNFRVPRPRVYGKMGEEEETKLG
ncbi:MAG TPA: hypothetical protein VGJ48_25220, partial [Pyrinomonadaceae bacterium]